MEVGQRVWQRTETQGLPIASTRVYGMAVCAFTVYGMLLASIVAYLCMGLQIHNILFFLLIGLVIPIAGITTAFSSKDWRISLLGYTMVVCGMGAITGPTVALFETAVVFNALVATCGVAIVMSLVGIMSRRSLEHWGAYLTGILIVVLLVSVARMFFPVTWHAPAPNTSDKVALAYYLWYVFDYLVAILFCVYIIYDWNRAMRIPHTIDNAVDSAVAIFLDVLNLFLRLLMIMGRKK